VDQDLDLCSACLCFGTSKPGDMVWSIGVHSSGSLDVMAMMRPESRSANMWIWTWICAAYVYVLGPQNLDVCLCFGISKSGDKYCWSIRCTQRGPGCDADDGT
jgi:hypothetical protein